MQILAMNKSLAVCAVALSIIFCVGASGADALTLKVEKDSDVRFRRVHLEGKVYRFGFRFASKQQGGGTDGAVYVNSKGKWIYVPFDEVPTELRTVMAHMGVVSVMQSKGDNTQEYVWFGNRQFRVNTHTGSVHEKMGSTYKQIDAELLPFHVRVQAYRLVNSRLEELIFKYGWNKIATRAGMSDYAQEKYPNADANKAIISQVLENLGVYPIFVGSDPVYGFQGCRMSQIQGCRMSQITGAVEVRGESVSAVGERKQVDRRESPVCGVPGGSLRSTPATHQRPWGLTALDPSHPLVAIGSSNTLSCRTLFEPRACRRQALASCGDTRSNASRRDSGREKMAEVHGNRTHRPHG